MFLFLHPQDHPAKRNISAERTQHVLPGQRGRLCNVPQMEGEQGQGTRVWRNHQVSGDAEKHMHTDRQQNIGRQKPTMLKCLKIAVLPASM